MKTSNTICSNTEGNNLNYNCYSDTHIIYCSYYNFTKITMTD